MDSKECSICKKVKDKSELQVINDDKPGIEYRCRRLCESPDAEKAKAEREQFIKENSGLSPEQFLQKYGISVDTLEKSKQQYRDGKTRYSFNNETYFYEIATQLWGKKV